MKLASDVPSSESEIVSGDIGFHLVALLLAGWEVFLIKGARLLRVEPFDGIAIGQKEVQIEGIKGKFFYMTV
jgi:hypothetical protein